MKRLLLLLLLTAQALAGPPKVVQAVGPGVQAGPQAIETDDSSSALVQLDEGALLYLKPGSRLEWGGPLRLSRGGAWARFAPQSQPFTLETTAGPVTVKGTEFVVDTSENGEGQVIVAEGQVDYAGAGVGAGQQGTSFVQEGKRVTLTGLPWDVDRDLQRYRQGELHLSELDAIALELAAARDKYLQDELYLARQRLEEIDARLNKRRMKLAPRFEEAYRKKVGEVPKDIFERLESWIPGS